MATKGVKVKEKKSNYASLKGFLFLFVLAFLFYPPFFRGLFFPETQHWALLFATVLFWVTWLVNRNEENIPIFGYKLDYLIIALVLVYIIACFDAANLRLALNEVVKATLYFLVYWIVSRNIRGLKEINLILNALYLSGLGVSLAGLMTATELIVINDGFIYGRIASTLQYANATGGYLIAIFLLGFYLWFQANYKTKYFYVFGNYITLTIFIATKSRGALLVLIPILLLLFIGISKQERVRALINVSFLAVLAILINIKLLDLITQGSYGLAWVSFLIGGLGALGVQRLQEKSFSLEGVRGRNIAIAASALVLILISGIAVAMISNSSLGQKISGAFSYVKEIKLDTRNSLERQYFYKDAFKMVLDRPVLGFGGGGWQAAYREFQSYNYSSRQVHNHYLQTWVETGTLGIAVLLSIWCFYFYSIYRLWKSKHENWNLIWITFLAALSLGLHAIIDFDLSLSAITLIVFAMIGLHRHFESKPETLSIDFARIKRFSGKSTSKYMLFPTIIALLLLMLASSNIIGTSYANKGTSTSSPYLAQEYLEQAVFYDPFSALNYAKLAEAYASTENLGKAIENGEKAHSLDSYNSDITFSLAGYFYRQGDYAKTLEYLELAKKSNRFSILTYESLARVNFLIGQNLMQQGNLEEAKLSFEKVINISKEMDATLSGLNSTEKWLWETGNFPPLKATPSIDLSIGSSYYFLGKHQQALNYLDKALQDQQLQGEVYLWQSLIAAKQGKNKESEELKHKAIQLIPQVEKDYELLSKIPTLN